MVKQRAEAGYSKYDIKKRRRATEGQEQEVLTKTGSSILVCGSYKFTECPVAYHQEDPGLVHLIGLINWSEDMKTPMFSGGLSSYTAWYHTVRGIVVNESRMIEYEEHEANRPKSKGSDTSGVRKPRVGGPRPGHGRKR